MTMMTWTNFLVNFNANYYSQAAINNKVEKFTRLQQGNMSVLEYVKRFDQLSCFAQDMVPTEAGKIWKFLSGLRLGLAGLVDTGSDGTKLMRLGVLYLALIKIENSDVKGDEGRNVVSSLINLRIFLTDK